MSDRDNSPNPGPGVPAESNDSATIGNRPATGARVVDHTTSFPGGFGGGAEATDFLGLSQELTGMDSAPFHPGHAGMPERTGPTGTHGGRTHPGEYPTQPESSASWLLQPEPIAGADEDPHAEETSDHGSGPLHGRTRTFSTWHKIAAVLILGTAATFGYRMWAGSQATEPIDAPATTIAQTPRPHTTPVDQDGLSQPTDGDAGGRQHLQPDGAWSDPELRPLVDTGTEAGTDTTTPDPGTGTEVAIDLTPAPATPRLGQERLTKWVEEHGWSTGPDSSGPLPGTLLTMLLGLGTNGAPMTTPPAGSSAADASPELAADPTTNPLSTTSTTLLRKGPSGEATPAKSPIGSLRLATPEELAGIWPGDTIPMDALDAERRLLTPGVGQVHVIMKTGEIFDGRLYAIGTGQVWLESTIGRLALDGKRVAAVTVVTTEEVNGKTVEDLPRMRVRTPGGIFFGKVVAHTDDRVTILTEDGGKITLVSRDVEPAPLGDTRVIGRVVKP